LSSDASRMIFPSAFDITQDHLPNNERCIKGACYTHHLYILHDKCMTIYLCRQYQQTISKLQRKPLSADYYKNKQ